MGGGKGGGMPGGGGKGGGMPGGGGAYYGGRPYYPGGYYPGGYYRYPGVGIGIGLGFGGFYPNSYYGYDAYGPRYSYYDLQYYSPYYPPNTIIMQQPQAPPVVNYASIRVYLPTREAKVWFDGNETKQTGTERYFYTPDLVPGGQYSYRIRAEWMVKNEPVIQEQVVAVVPNQTSVVDFTRPVTEPVPKS
jgi:uncharacterized protein (TIGR03000 family)